MDILNYKKVKEFDAINNTENVKVSLINGTPALTVKKYNTFTGELLTDTEQISIDVTALGKQVENLQEQIDSLNELIIDANALI